MPGPTVPRLNNLEFTPALDSWIASRQGESLTVLSGGNNSGKSLVLKHLKKSLGAKAYMVGTNRFYHVYHFSTGLRNPTELDQFETQFAQQFYEPTHNHEQNFIDLGRVILNLSDDGRQRLFDLCGELIGNRFAMKKEDPTNDLSPRYIDMDGQNLSLGSSGARLLMTLLGICMDDRFDAVLIDEPELGLSPRIQNALGRLMEDDAERRKHFPHLKRVVIATHSHLFLARDDVTRNFVVTKDGARFNLRALESRADFHQLQFNLLGNTLEGLFLPSAIVVVEGTTDNAFLDRLLRLSFPERRITVPPGQGDVKRVVSGLRHALGDLQQSPLRGRVFVVVDSVHPYGLSADLEKLGVLPSNIVVWSENGIEHLYPPELVARSFGVSPDVASTFSISGDHILVAGQTKTKAELSRDVVASLEASTKLPAELESRLLDPVRRAME